MYGDMKIEILWKLPSKISAEAATLIKAAFE